MTRAERAASPGLSQEGGSLARNVKPSYLCLANGLEQRRFKKKLFRDSRFVKNDEDEPSPHRRDSGGRRREGKPAGAGTLLASVAVGRRSGGAAEVDAHPEVRDDVPSTSRSMGVSEDRRREEFGRKFKYPEFAANGFFDGV